MSSEDIDADTTSPDRTITGRENPPTERSSTTRSDQRADEHRSLRGDHARFSEPQHRRIALGLTALGLGIGVAGVLFPNTRDVLFTLAAAGLFGGVLTYYLSPDRHVATVIGESVYTAVASNGVALTDALGLVSNPIYVPADTVSGVHLFIADRSEYRIPEDLSVPGFTEDDYSGLVLEPTGVGLFREFERVLPGDLPTAPDPLAAALAEGLVDGLELAGGADPDVDGATGRATIAISDGRFGPLDQFDHPIASFLGIGFATGLDRPVVLTVEPGGDRADWLATYRWETDDA